MSITDPFMLDPDVRLIPVTELPEPARRRLPQLEGDVALTRVRGRTPSRLVDARCAALLEAFRSPCTLVEAVLRFSRARGLEPDPVLVEVFPILEQLIGAGFLVPESVARPAGIQPSFAEGMALDGQAQGVALDGQAQGVALDGYTVVSCLQVLEDTEVYQVRGPAGVAALKLARLEAAAQNRLPFAREAAILEHLGGWPAPALLGAGELEGRPYLLLEWCAGVSAAQAAADLRETVHAPGALLAMCRAILEAYRTLHSGGVLHGDVHPRNVLVDGAGRIRLVDFGLSVRIDGPVAQAGPGRGGVAFYFEPELAEALRAGRTPPPASPASEQYALAALLYQLVTGVHSRDFQLGREAMLDQIAKDPPLPFEHRGLPAWPSLEAVLTRALEKRPEDRYPDLAAFARALEQVSARPASPSPSIPRDVRSPFSRASHRREGDVLLETVLERLQAEGALFRGGPLEPPTASVTFGAAGIALGLYRIALAREEGSLLALADLWATRAARLRGDDAFYHGAELSLDQLGRVSPYHTSSGVQVTQALIAHSLGLSSLRRQAIAGFLEATRAPCEQTDLVIGRAGVLLACAMLHDLTHGAGEAAPLVERGDQLLGDLWRSLEPLSANPAGACRPNLGIAHGRAGLLYAALRWCRSAARPMPEGLEQRLAELAAWARPRGRGLCWPWHRDGADGRPRTAPMSGWCNGSAGFVHLWTLAAQLVKARELDALAEGAAWDTWEASSAPADLCCGLAGRAYALLNYYRHSGARVWLERAEHLAVEAARVAGGSSRPDSLYRGALGVAVLVAELSRPDRAAQPLFEDEGWRAPAGVL